MKIIDVSPGKTNVVRTATGQTATSIIGPNDSVFYPAGESILAGQLIALVSGKAYRYDVGQRAHAYTLIGIALNSSLPLGVLAIGTGPTVIVPGWGLTPGVSYRAGRDGRLMIGTADPDAAFSQVIGRAASSQELVFTPQLIILS